MDEKRLQSLISYHAKRRICAFLRREHAGARNIRFGSDGGVTATVDRMPNTDKAGRIFVGWANELDIQACREGM